MNNYEQHYDLAFDTFGAVIIAIIVLGLLFAAIIHYFPDPWPPEPGDREDRNEFDKWRDENTT